MKRVAVVSLQAGGSRARLYEGREPDISMWRMSPAQATAWQEARSPFEAQALTGEMPTVDQVVAAATIMEGVMPGQVSAYRYNVQIWPPDLLLEQLRSSSSTLAELARETGVSYQQLQDWKGGRRPIPAHQRTGLDAALRAILERG